MPLLGRRLPPPPAHASRSSPSHHRHRSPDRRRMRPHATDISLSRQREVRRSSEHASSRSHPDARSRPRESRDTLPVKRPSLPEPSDPTGRSYSASSSIKRKASPKLERDIARPLDRAESTSSSRLLLPPRKMMRSSSPEIPPSREILHPGLDASPRRYAHSSAVISTRHYSGANEVKPVARSYTITPAPPPVARYAGDISPPVQRYSNPSRGYVEPPTATETHGYVPASKSTATRSTFRRSASEERLLDRPSAQKSATGHLTSSRFGEMRDSEEASLFRSDRMTLNPATLSSYIFNIKNEPDPKFNLDQRNVVRKLVDPESLQVVRRPG